MKIRVLKMLYGMEFDLLLVFPAENEENENVSEECRIEEGAKREARERLEENVEMNEEESVEIRDEIRDRVCEVLLSHVRDLKQH